MWRGIQKTAVLEIRALLKVNHTQPKKNYRKPPIKGEKKNDV